MRISKEKRDRISEQILSFFYNSFPKQPFTAEISREIARDEEFIKKLLFELKDRGLIVSIRQNKNKEPFSRKIKWKLSNKVYEVYNSRH